jgi:hypothetical protein
MVFIFMKTVLVRQGIRRNRSRVPAGIGTRLISLMAIMRETSQYCFQTAEELI